jgi:hypothetical protein
VHSDRHEEKTASLYTALLDGRVISRDHPGQDKSRALRPHSGGGDTIGDDQSTYVDVRQISCQVLAALGLTS